MRDTNLIEDSDVAVEVLKATLSDESYGYLSECTKRSIGAEYERRLKRHLRKLNISFQVIYNTGNDRFTMSSNAKSQEMGPFSLKIDVKP